MKEKNVIAVMVANISSTLKAVPHLGSTDAPEP